MWNFIKRLRAEVSYRRAVRKADATFKATNIRQFVVRGIGHKLMVIDRPSLKHLKKHGIIGKNVRVIDLQLNCYYATPDASGRERMNLDQINGRKRQCIKFLMGK